MNGPIEDAAPNRRPRLTFQHRGRIVFSSAMKRIASSVMVFVFVVGMLILPALHCLHCDCDDHGHHTDGHHEDDCPICQLAHAPLDLAETQITVAPTALLPVIFVISYLAPVLSVSSDDATQARAPPAA